MTLTLLLYCITIIVASVLGGLIPLVLRLTHNRLQLAISLTAGFMLGVALLHMIPHAVADTAHGPVPGGLTLTGVMGWVLGGFLFMFFIERFFSFHTHEVAELDSQGQVVTSAEDLPEHDHETHDCHHDHAHAHGMVGATAGNQLSWTGAAVGMSLHSVIGGVALASAVAAEHAAGSLWPGLAVWLVIVLHKPLDALTVITLTATAGFEKLTRHLINALFALAVPVGVLLFYFGLSQTGLAESATLVGAALAFSAGTFLCIALSDLLPELHFHAHDRGKLSAALLLGIGLAWAIATAEHSMHDHGHHDAHDQQNAEIEGHDDSHPAHRDENHDHEAGHGQPSSETLPPSEAAIKPTSPRSNLETHEGPPHGEHHGHDHDHDH